jgi:hypothetical protein
MGPNFLPPPRKKAASRPPSARIKRKVKIADECKFVTIAKKGDGSSLLAGRFSDRSEPPIR